MSGIKPEVEYAVPNRSHGVVSQGSASGYNEPRKPIAERLSNPGYAPLTPTTSLNNTGYLELEHHINCDNLNIFMYKTDNRNHYHKIIYEYILNLENKSTKVGTTNKPNYNQFITHLTDYCNSMSTPTSNPTRLTKEDIVKYFKTYRHNIDINFSNVLEQYSYDDKTYAFDRAVTMTEISQDEYNAYDENLKTNIYNYLIVYYYCNIIIKHINTINTIPSILDTSNNVIREFINLLTNYYNNLYLKNMIMLYNCLSYIYTSSELDFPMIIVTEFYKCNDCAYSVKDNIVITKPFKPFMPFNELTPAEFIRKVTKEYAPIVILYSNKIIINDNSAKIMFNFNDLKDKIIPLITEYIYRYNIFFTKYNKKVENNHNLGFNSLFQLICTMNALIDFITKLNKPYIFYEMDNKINIKSLFDLYNNIVFDKDTDTTTFSGNGELEDKYLLFDYENDSYKDTVTPIVPNAEKEFVKYLELCTEAYTPLYTDFINRETLTHNITTKLGDTTIMYPPPIFFMSHIISEILKTERFTNVGATESKGLRPPKLNTTSYKRSEFKVDEGIYYEVDALAAQNDQPTVVNPPNRQAQLVAAQPPQLPQRKTKPTTPALPPPIQAASSQVGTTPAQTQAQAQAQAKPGPVRRFVRALRGNQSKSNKKERSPLAGSNGDPGAQAPAAADNAARESFVGGYRQSTSRHSKRKLKKLLNKQSKRLNK